MKVKLEFSFPEEREEFELAMKAGEMQCAINEFYNFLRNKIKHSDLSEDEERIYVEVRDKFVEIVSEYDIEV